MFYKGINSYKKVIRRDGLYNNVHKLIFRDKSEKKIVNKSSLSPGTTSNGCHDKGKKTDDECEEILNTHSIDNQVNNYKKLGLQSVQNFCDNRNTHEANGEHVTSRNKKRPTRLLLINNFPEVICEMHKSSTQTFMHQ